MYSKVTTLVILKRHANTLIKKERLSPTSKARREASQNEFWEKGGMPDKIKSFREIKVERIIREPGLGLLNPSKMDLERNAI